MPPDRTFLQRAAFWAVWLFVFSLPSEKSIEIASLGTASRLCGALAAAATILATASSLRVRKLQLFHALMGAFVLWSATTFLWTFDADLTREKIQSFLQLLVLAWLIWEACPAEAQVRSLLGAYVAGTIVPFGDTVQRFLSGKQTFYQRYATTGFDPNDLALTMALSIPAAYYLSLSAGPRLVWLLRAQMIVATGTIFLTASRGGTVALVVGLSLIVTTGKLLNRRERTAVAAAGLLLIPVAIWLVPATSWKRIATLGSEVTAGTLNSRTLLWKGGWEAFQRSPFEGVGLGAYPKLLEPVVGQPWGFTPVAHNTFLSVLVETGLPGFTLYFCAFAMLLRMAWRLPWLEKRLWLTTLAVWTIGVMSLTWEHRKPTWLVFGLLAAHSAVAAGQRAPSTLLAERRAWIAAEGSIG